MRKLVVGLVVVTGLAFSASAFAEKIGVVDMKQVFQNAPQVNKINDQLKTQFASRQKQLEAQSQQLQSDVQKLQSQKAVMKASDIDALNAKISKEGQAFQQAQAAYQQDLGDARQSAIGDFMGILRQAATQVAAQDKLDLIIPADSVLYSDKDMDVTADMLKALKNMKQS